MEGLFLCGEDQVQALELVKRLEGELDTFKNEITSQFNPVVGLSVGQYAQDTLAPSLAHSQLLEKSDAWCSSVDDVRTVADGLQEAHRALDAKS